MFNPRGLIDLLLSGIGFAVILLIFIGLAVLLPAGCDSPVGAVCR